MKGDLWDAWVHGRVLHEHWLHRCQYPDCDTVAETSNWETKHHTQRVGKLRFIMPEGPEGLILQGEPWTKGLESFYRQTMVGNTINWFKLRGFTRRGTTVKAGEGECLAWTGMINQVCRGWRIAKSRTRVSEINSSSYYRKSLLSETTWPMWSRLCKGQTELQRQKEEVM